MSWQFQEWKQFAGAAGAAAIVLAIAGMLVNDTPWFDRDPANYVTIRDDCEILGGFAERETAMADTTNFTPLADAWWWGSFPERHADVSVFGVTNWTTVDTTTNAAGIYNTREFWSGLEMRAGDYFPLGGPRYWISTDAAGVVAAAGTLGEGDYDIMTNDFIMADAWWRANVYDGETRFPAVGWYVTTQQLACVQQSMAYCAHTLEANQAVGGWDIEWYGATQSFVVVSGTPPPTWNHGQERDWPDLIAGALTNMMASREDPDWSIDGCHGHEVIAGWECWTSTNSWLDGGSPRDYVVDRRTVGIYQYAIRGDGAALVIGNNASAATGIGRPSRLYADPDDAIFWHGTIGYTEPDTLLTAACTEANVVENVRRVRNPLLAWDGHPGLATVEFFFTFAGDFPPAEGTSHGVASGSVAAGWDQEAGQAGILIDWSFDHMTTPAGGAL